jgi:beta-phosphoglucomutase-like phosphatase (HAD superfamily)
MAMRTNEGPGAQLRALLFDLGDTLERDGVVLAGVPEALTAIAAVRTHLGEPVPRALVSDVGPASTPEEIAAAFSAYVAEVRRLGLLPWFDPPEVHVTLSAQAGVRKPDPRVFALALTRLGLAPDLAGAAFFTEDAAHVEAARALGMTALRFGAGGDFDDWAAAPLLVIRLAGTDDPATLLTALNLRLEQRHGISLARLDRIALGGEGPGTIVGTTPPGPDGVARSVEVTLAKNGDVAALRTEGGGVSTDADAARFRGVLEDNHAVGRDLAPGVTHTLEPDAEGAEALQRRRFSIH